MGIGDELVSLSEYISARTIDRLSGLTDDEFLWQPAPGAWTVRRLRSGRVVVDGNMWPGTPAPMTSIGWRIAHLVDIYGSPRNAEWLRVPDPPTPPVGTLPWNIRATAGESIDLLRTAIEHFHGVLRSVDEADWTTPIGAIGGPYADSSLASLATHQIDEAIHHGAEVGILRDLYLWRAAPAGAEPTTVAEAADAGRWDLVETLTAGGADVNATSTGRTALHQAAATGDLEIVKLLVEHGADTTVVDPDFHATPLGWAQYFNRADVVGFLQGLA